PSPRSGLATEVVVRSGIDSRFRKRRRRRRPIAEEILEEEDAVRDVHDARVVEVEGIGAAMLALSAEEIEEDARRVVDPKHAIERRVSAHELGLESHRGVRLPGAR